MGILLIIAWLCNLVDAAATLHLYSMHGYTEANPVMAALLQWPGLFALVKVAAMTTVVVWLWRGRGSKYARAASWVAAILYGAIALYYVWFFTFYI